MKSWEILREAIDRVGVKFVAAKLGVSAALVYKWCQESPQDDPDASGARNPLDRLREIYEVTLDERIINWMCMVGGGAFVPNPVVDPREQDEHVLSATQHVVKEFGSLLTHVSQSYENDGQISVDEADRIRQVWETLKSQAECFVRACELGLYRRSK